MNRIIAIVLIVAGAALGIYGLQKMKDSKAGIEIGNLEITTKNKKKSGNGLAFFVLGGVAVVGGFTMLSRKSIA